MIELMLMEIAKPIWSSLMNKLMFYSIVLICMIVTSNATFSQDEKFDVNDEIPSFEYLLKKYDCHYKRNNDTFVFNITKSYFKLNAIQKIIRLKKEKLRQNINNCHSALELQKDRDLKKDTITLESYANGLKSNDSESMITSTLKGKIISSNFEPIKHTVYEVPISTITQNTLDYFLDQYLFWDKLENEMEDVLGFNHENAKNNYEIKYPFKGKKKECVSLVDQTEIVSKEISDAISFFEENINYKIVIVLKDTCSLEVSGITNDIIVFKSINECLLEIAKSSPSSFLMPAVVYVPPYKYQTKEYADIYFRIISKFNLLTIKQVYFVGDTCLISQKSESSLQIMKAKNETQLNIESGNSENNQADIEASLIEYELFEGYKVIKSTQPIGVIVNKKLSQNEKQKNHSDSKAKHIEFMANTFAKANMTPEEFQKINFSSPATTLAKLTIFSTLDQNGSIVNFIFLRPYFGDEDIKSGELLPFGFYIDLKGDMIVISGKISDTYIGKSPRIYLSESGGFTLKPSKINLNK